MTDGLKVEVGLDQELVPSPFLFTMMMDRLTDKFRQESPWMFGDDIVTVMSAWSRRKEKKKRDRTGGCRVKN